MEVHVTGRRGDGDTRVLSVVISLKGHFELKRPEAQRICRIVSCVMPNILSEMPAQIVNSVFRIGICCFLFVIFFTI